MMSIAMHRFSIPMPRFHVDYAPFRQCYAQKHIDYEWLQAFYAHFDMLSYTHKKTTT